MADPAHSKLTTILDPFSSCKGGGWEGQGHARKEGSEDALHTEHEVYSKPSEPTPVYCYIRVSTVVKLFNFGIIDASMLLF